MVDAVVLKAITKAAKLSAGDPVLEVGPGTGALTRHLLAKGANVTAVEKDYGLYDRLAAEFAAAPSLRLICGDILRQNLTTLLEEMLMVEHPSTLSPSEVNGDDRVRNDNPKVKVVANLPYYITKDFLLQTLPLGNQLSSLLLMVQDEVAIRLTQELPGGPDWRSINIILRYYCTPKYLFKIDRRKYVPSPKVHGAVIRLDLRPPQQRPEVPSETEFLKLVKKSFLQRRKVLRNALQPLVSAEQVATALEAAGLPLDARAQSLGLDDFVKLSWEISKVRDASA